MSSLLPFSFNGYVLNDPVNWVDPLGLKRVKAFETKQVTYQIYYIYFVAPTAELPSDPGFDPYDNHLPDPFIDEKVYYIEIPDEYVLLNTTQSHYKHSEVHLTYIEVSHLLMNFYWWGCPE